MTRPTRRPPSRSPLRRLAASGALTAILASAPSASSASSVVTAAASDPGASPAEELPFDPRVVRDTLPNGVAYYIRENGRPEARADLRLVVKAGSVDEDDDQRGLAHFVEHMLFNGTENFAGNEIVDYLESIGARFGADLNAYTSFDETVYMLHVPTDREGLLERGIGVLAEFAARATFDSTEVERERGVVLDEWRRGRGASARIRDEQLPVVLRGSRYAERLPIGLPEIIEKAPREALVRYYRDWYRPERMAVVAVGDFEAPAVERAILEAFGAIAETEPSRGAVDWDVPAAADTAFALSDDPEVTRTSIGIGWKRPLVSEATPAGYRRDLVRGLATSMLNDRFAERAREDDPPFLGAGLSVESFGRTTELVQLQARVQDGGEARGLEALVATLRRATRHGFLESEADRARRDLLAGLEAAFAEREKTDSRAYVGELTRHVLEDEPVPGIERELELVRGMLPAITAEECSQALRELANGGGVVVTAARPERESMANEDALRETLRRAATEPVEAYVDSAAGATLLANPRPPGRMTRVRDLAAIGVSEWVLDNGVRVFLKPTTFQDDEILFVGTASGGTSVAPDEDLLSAELALSIAGESGYGGHSILDLGKLLAGKIVHSRPYFDERWHGISGSSTVADLPTALELAVIQMAEPNEDPAAFRRVLERLTADVKNRDADPGVKFQDRLIAINTSDAPRRRPLTVERLPEIDPAKALAFYRAAFANAADFTFFFTGNFEEAKLTAEIERTLGSLPSAGKPSSAYVVRPEPFPRETVKEIVRAGVEPKAQTAIAFRSYDGDDPDEWHRLRSNLAILERRLRERLREALGATYSVSVQYDRMLLGPDEGTIRIRFGSDPDDAERLGEEALRLAAEFREKGPTDEEVETEKTLQLREVESSLLRNDFWLGNLRSLHLRGRPLIEILDRRARIDALTVDDLTVTARKSIRPTPHTWVVWMPAK